MRALLFAALLAFTADDPVVSVRVDKDETLCTVKATQVGVDVLLRELGQKCGREVIGLDATWVFDPIDVDLADRPLDITVDGLAGAAGLRAQVKASSITLRPDLDDKASVEQLEDMSEVMFVRALRRFPDSEGAAAAEMALGEIQETRRNDSAARSHYEALVRAYPDSHLVGEALFRSSTLHQRHAEWNDAAAGWSQLANRPPPNPYAVKARVELTRCLAFQGDGHQALALIDALDRTMPPETKADSADRMYVRAAALVAADRGTDALAALDAAMALGLDQASSADAVRLRAEAFDHAGMPGEAARSWLAWADSGGGEDRRRTALTRAARSASKAGDQLGVLFIERMAAKTSAESDILPIADKAREGLGLEVKKVDVRGSRIERAEGLCAQGEFDAALRALETPWNERTTLGEPDLTRVVLVHARCTGAMVDAGAAVGELRLALDDVHYPDNRRRIYLLAGELYENASLWDLAAQAYGGRL
jgi:tetratricopeptide (TPR) repeat protein